jgi:exodeoxyribonuclease-3
VSGGFRVGSLVVHPGRRLHSGFGALVRHPAGILHSKDAQQGHDELELITSLCPTKQRFKAIQVSRQCVQEVAETPALRRVGLPGDPDDSHSRYIEAEVGGLIVASIYLPNGNPIGTDKFDYKLKWIERLRAHAAELLAEEQPVVLAGDFNVVPEDRDVFSMRAAANDALVQPETRAAWRQLIYQGWTDALRAFHPDEDKLWTFWDYTAGAWPRDAGFRIDHLLCSPSATDRLKAAGVDKWVRGEEKASDHAPTWVEFD